MWGQFTLNISSLSPKRDWGPKRVKVDIAKSCQPQPISQTKSSSRVRYGKNTTYMRFPHSLQLPTARLSYIIIVSDYDENVTETLGNRTSAPDSIRNPTGVDLMLGIRGGSTIATLQGTSSMRWKPHVSKPTKYWG